MYINRFFRFGLILIGALAVALILSPLLVNAAPGTNEASLSVTKSVSDEPLVGGEIGFTIDVANTAPLVDGLEDDKAYNVTVTDTLPVGVIYSSSNPAPNSVIDNGDGTTTLVWTNIQDVEAQESFAIQLSATLSPGLGVGTAVVNTAIACGTKAPNYVACGVDPAQDVGPATGSVSADLQAIDIEKSVLQSTGVGQATGASGWEDLAPGETGAHEWPYDYLITVQNNNVGDTNSVIVTDTLPSGVAYIGPTTITDGGSSSNVEPTMIPQGDGSMLLVWNLGTLTTADYTTPVEIQFSTAIPYQEADGNSSGCTRTVPPVGGASADPRCFDGAIIPDDSVWENEYDATGDYLGSITRDGTTFTPADDQTADVKASYLTIQKSGTPVQVTYGQTVDFTLNWYVSEYYTMSSVIITDVLPDGMTFVPGTVSHAVASVTEDTPGPGQTTITWDLDALGIATTPGRNGTITLQATVDVSYELTSEPVLAFDTLTNNTSNLGDYTDDVDPGRTGVSGDADSASVQTLGPMIDKKVWDNDNSIWVEDTITATVGDDLLFRLEYVAPAGMDAGDNYLQDFLPDGMRFVSQVGCNVSPAWTGGGADPTENDPCIPQAGTLHGLDTVLWDYGNVESNFTAVYTISVEVADEPTVQDGVIVANFLKSSGVNTSGETYSLRDLAYVEYIAPDLELTKSVGDATGDTTDLAPGTRITYTIDIENLDERAIAHNLIVTDTVPQFIEIDTASCSANLGFTPTCTVASGSPTTGGGGVIVWTFTGTNDLNPGSTLNLSYGADISLGAPADAELINVASVRFNSQEDDSGREYPSTSNTSDTNTDDASVTIPNASISKGTPQTQVTIGDMITYYVTMTVPAHTSLPNAVMRDWFKDNGMVYTDTITTLSLVSGSPDVAATLGSPTINYTYNLDSSDRRAQIDFPLGDIDNSSSSSDYVFVVTLQAIVNGLADNGTDWEWWQPNSSDRANNQAQLRWTDDQGNENRTSGTTNTVVVQPLIDLTKTASPGTSLNGGDAVTFTLTMENVGSSTAYEVDLVDTVPAGLIIPASGLYTADAGAQAGTGGVITWTQVASIAAGATVTRTYNATIVNDVPTGAQLTNVADANWSSLPGDDPNERVYNDTSDSSYTDDTDTETITIASPNLSKTIDSTSHAHTSDSGTPDVTIGEIITYALTVDIPYNTTSVLTVTDQLDSGLVFVGSPTITSHGDISIGAGPSTSYNGANTLMTITFGSVDNNNLTTPRTIDITYTVRVDDVAGNVGGSTTLNNTATLYHDNGSLSRSQAVEVVEPTVTIDKTMLPAIAEAGDTVTVTLTAQNTGGSAAFEVIVEDDIDPTIFDVGTIANIGGPAGFAYSVDTSNPPTSTVLYTGGVISESQTIVMSFTVQLRNDFSLQTITNTATVRNATTLPGVDPNERTEPEDTDDAVINTTLGSIGDTIWFDYDGMGDQDGGEPGIGGVIVNLEWPDGRIYTQTTDSNGNYLFDNLPTGRAYTVTVNTSTLPPEYDFVQTGDPDGVVKDNAHTYLLGTAGPNEEYEDADFGYQPQQPASIGDFVWYDTDNDGIQDADEMGIANVDVILYEGGTAIMTTTTDANGGYLFDELTSGTYTVSVATVNPALTGYTTTSGPDVYSSSTPIVLSNGDAYRDADFGYVQTPAAGNALLGDTVWYDADQDGIQDDGEVGIEGAIVVISDGTSTYTRTTDINGNYSAELPAGTYTVTVTPPAGLTQTYDLDGTLNNQTKVKLTDGMQFLDADFGYYDAAGSTFGRIGNQIWLDQNGDGMFSTGVESGIAGVTVDLIDPATGDIIATATTNANGEYIFEGLPADTYEVVVSDSNGILYAYTETTLGTPATDNNHQAQPYSITLPAGGENLTADFGYVDNPIVPGDTGAIGNQIWFDVDGDGTFDDGESGIPGVTVVLYDSGGTPIMTTTTGADGTYLFASLPAGTYSVGVPNAPTGMLPSAIGPNPGDDNNNQASGSTYSVTLATDEVNTTADFAFTQPASVGDYVWYDGDNDGTQDYGEPGMANVTVVLSQGGTPVMTTTTDANGGYLFTSLTPGDYTVAVVDGVTGLSATSGPMTHNPADTISLAPAEHRRDVDFGYVDVPPLGNGVIGDTVWVDVDGDGYQDDSEVGIEGVVVTFTDGSTTITTTTDINGRYLQELPAGTWTVSITPPAGMTPTYDYDLTPDNSTTVVVFNNTFNMDIDFGLQETVPGTLLGSISNQIWVDDNGNGSFDSGSESGIDGVTVNLIDPATGDIIATTTTESDGTYLFEGLAADDYQVMVADNNGVLMGYVPTAITGSGDGVNKGLPHAVTLGAGEDYVEADFGFVQLELYGSGNAAIGNFVWLDNTDNGHYDPEAGDEPLAGVVMGLQNAAGTVIMTTTTDADGSYWFTGLPAGDYSVVVLSDLYDITSPLFGLSEGTVNDVPGDDYNRGPSYSATLAPNEINSYADFAFQAPGRATAVTLSSTGTINAIPSVIIFVMLLTLLLATCTTAVLRTNKRR